MPFRNISSLCGLFAAICVVFVLTGCVKDHTSKTHTYTYTITTPIYETKSQMLSAINGNSTEPVKTAGKLYFKDQYIYLNEVNKGIHIVDNSNPAKPTQVAFLNIPGNIDIAVKGNTLYADTYSDLLAIDITNPKKVVVTKSIPNFFLYRMYGALYNRDTSMVVVGLVQKDTTVTIVNTDYGDCINCAIAFSSTAPAANATSKSNGTAGSMASMVLMNDYLYALRESHSMGIVNVHAPAQPTLDTTFNAGFDLQTVYPFEDKLFLGSMSGMYMYDMSNPTVPVKLGVFSHGRACDPVVTDGDYAYVTLHAGTTCGGAANELNVIDIKNLMSPTLVKAYELTKPTGLCKDGNLLFVCDDDSGVRIYDASKADALKQLNKIDIKGSYDIIAGNKHAMIVTKEGLYQYDYSDLNNIKPLSVYSLSN